MEKATGTSLSFGSAIFAAERAAAVVAVMCSSGPTGYRETLSNVNGVMVRYGESNTVTEADFDDLKTVTRKLYKVFTKQKADKAATLLNEILAEYATAPRLSNHSDSTWHLHVDSDDHAPWAEWFAASSALALAILLAEKGRNPCGLCASLSCRRPFIDLGKGGGRSYCSPRCATRERVAAYRRKSA